MVSITEISKLGISREEREEAKSAKGLSSLLILCFTQRRGDHTAASRNRKPGLSRKDAKLAKIRKNLSKRTRNERLALQRDFGLVTLQGGQFLGSRRERKGTMFRFGRGCNATNAFVPLRALHLSRELIPSQSWKQRLPIA
jgi:hypothetical protein